MNKGTYLLHAFAWGAILEKLHGDKNYQKKVRRYLETKDANLEKELIGLAPEKLLIAWDYLSKKSKKDPFNLNLVKKYIQDDHNKIVPAGCAVKKAKVAKIKPDKIEALDDSGKKISIKYLPCLAEGLKEEDSVWVHYGWGFQKLKM